MRPNRRACGQDKRHQRRQHGQPVELHEAAHQRRKRSQVGLIVVGRQGVPQKPAARHPLREPYANDAAADDDGGEAQQPGFAGPQCAGHRQRRDDVRLLGHQRQQEEDACQGKATGRGQCQSDQGQPKRERIDPVQRRPKQSGQVLGQEQSDGEQADGPARRQALHAPRQGRRAHQRADQGHPTPNRIATVAESALQPADDSVVQGRIGDVHQRNLVGRCVQAGPLRHLPSPIEQPRLTVGELVGRPGQAARRAHREEQQVHADETRNEHPERRGHPRRASLVAQRATQGR